jgi:hypothetical protein
MRAKKFPAAPVDGKSNSPATVGNRSKNAIDPTDRDRIRNAILS